MNEECPTKETLVNNNLSQISTNLEEDSLIIKDFKEVSICLETPQNTKALTKSDKNFSKIHNIIWGKSKAEEYKTAHYHARAKVEWKPYSKTTYTATSKFKSFEEKLQSPSWVKNREIMMEAKRQRLEKLEREKDPEQLTEYEKLKLKLKTTLKAIKKWELKFLEKMGKKPSRQEIDQLPKVRAMYQSFQNLSKQVKTFELDNPNVINKSSFMNQTNMSAINQSIFNATNFSNTNISMAAPNASAFDISLLNTSRMDKSAVNMPMVAPNASALDISLPITSRIDNMVADMSNMSFLQGSKINDPSKAFEAANMSILDPNTPFLDNSILNTSRTDNSIVSMSNVSFSQGLKIIGPPKASEIETNLPTISLSSQNQSNSPESLSNNQDFTPPENDQLSQPLDNASDIPTSDIWEFDIPSSQRSIIPEDHPLSKVYTTSPYYLDDLNTQSTSSTTSHLDQWLSTTQNLMKKYFPNIEEEIRIELHNPTITLTEPLAPKHPLLHVIPGYHSSTRRLKSQLSSEIYDGQRDYSLEIEPYFDWEDEMNLQNVENDQPLEGFNDESANISTNNDKATTTKAKRSSRTTKTNNLTKKDLVSDNFVKLNTKNSRYRSKLPGRSRFSKTYFKRK